MALKRSILECQNWKIGKWLTFSCFLTTPNGFTIGGCALYAHFTSGPRIWGWPWGQTAHLRPKIFREINHLSELVKWHNFQENWRFWVIIKFCGIQRWPVKPRRTTIYAFHEKYAIQTFKIFFCKTMKPFQTKVAIIGRRSVTFSKMCQEIG